MATTRSTAFVVTAAIWNAVLSGLNDAGNVFTGVSATLSGAFSAASAAISGALSAASAAISGALTVGTTLGVGGTINATGNITSSGIVGASSFITAGGALFERGRVVAVGEEIPVPFVGLNFNWQGSGTFIVASFDVASNSYTLLGKQLFWDLIIIGGATTGSVTRLDLTIPGGFTCVHAISANVAIFSDGVNTQGNVRAEVAAGGTFVAVSLNSGGAFAVTANMTLYLNGRIPIA